MKWHHFVNLFIERPQYYADICQATNCTAFNLLWMREKINTNFLSEQQI